MTENNDKKEAAERLMNGLSCVREDFIAESAKENAPKDQKSRKLATISGVLAAASILIIGGILWWILSDRPTKDPAVQDTSSETENTATEITTEGNLPKGFPTLSEVTSYSFDQLIELVKDLDEDTLIRAWGEPYKTQYQRIWKVEQNGKTAYVEAFVQDGKVLSVNNSTPMYAVVAKKHHGETYCFLDWGNYSIDRSKLCHMPKADVYGNSITCEVGDKICLATNGIVMESYPGMINDPYEAVHEGRLTDEEMKKLESEINSVSDVFGE